SMDLRIGSADTNMKSAIRFYHCADRIGSDGFADQIKAAKFGSDADIHRGYADRIGSMCSPTCGRMEYLCGRM
ncbi:hypothetical protein PIB30_100635, partial [Stylosanthes scabra]|nr:hypothetical protein [Stylosanthes scabra]